jgi:hypothetical protein
MRKRKRKRKRNGQTCWWALLKAPKDCREKTVRARKMMMWTLKRPNMGMRSQRTLIRGHSK